MSGRVKIKSKDKDKKPKIDVFKIIENRFKNMNELRDLIDMDPKKGLVRIRDGAGFREVERGGCLHRNYLNLLEEELGAKLSIDLRVKKICLIKYMRGLMIHPRMIWVTYPTDIIPLTNYIGIVCFITQLSLMSLLRKAI